MPLPFLLPCLRCLPCCSFSTSFHALSMYGVVLLYSMISAFPRYGSRNLCFSFLSRRSFRRCFLISFVVGIFSGFTALIPDRQANW